MHFPEFHKALLTWRRAASRELRSADFYVRGFPSPWEKGRDGNYRPNQNALSWHYSAFEQVQEIAQYRALEDAAWGSRVIARHLDVLVGTARMRHRVTVADLVRPFLPRPRLDAAASAVVQVYERPFRVLYASLEEFLANDLVRRKVVWPLPGLTLEQSRLQLQDDVCIRRMTSEEVSAALSLGILGDFAMRPPLYVEDDQGTFGMVFAARTQKLLGDVSDADVSEATDVTQTLAEDLRVSAALVGIGRLGIYGCVEASDWPPATGGSFGLDQRAPWDLRPTTVSRGHARALRSAWRAIRSVGEANPSLLLSARRLAYRANRSRPEDQLLDLMIAAEALYLGKDDKSELAYKLAMRAAFWAEPRVLGMAPREVFEVMKKAYSLRSVVAHGGVLKQQPISVSGRTVTFEQFLAQCDAVIQNGVFKALCVAQKAVDGRFKSDWDSLILRNA